jgi:5-bromo-4-chloroindolyl phosphate hydrolysis protein
MQNFAAAFGVVGLILLVVVLIGIGPVLTILALNTLFGLGIVINIWTWLSVAWLSAFFAAFKVKRS